MKTIEPPHSFEAEQDILGGLLKDSGKHESREALDSISDNDFYTSAHQKIFQTIKEMVSSRYEVNAVTVESELNRKGFSEYCGGLTYLGEMQKAFISHGALKGSCKLLTKLREARDLINLSNNIGEAVSSGMDNNEIISSIESSVKDISTSFSGRDLEHVREAEGDWLDMLDRRVEAGGGILGVSTGFEQLDEAIGGLDEEALIVVGGAPSMGKTLFTQALTLNVGVDQKKNTMFFSMEMSARQLYERFISGLSTVKPSALKLARFDKIEQARIAHAAETLRSSGIYFTDEPALSVAQIRSKVRKHKAKKDDIGLIVIDYLGLITLERADRHDIAIGNVTRSLKELAKEIRTPIVLIAQANRTNTRPNMRSLKDSSCIEADADVIMFVHRQEILEPETELKGITELIIAKDRHNDGNGTIYMEKVSGGFRELTKEQAASMVHLEEVRLNPPKESKSRGYKTN